MGLIAAAGDLPAVRPGLAGEVAAAIEARGLPSQPVTAVLLVIRGYDTWLELAVLLLAVLGVLVLGTRAGPDAQAHDPILDTFARMIVPVAALVAGHLLLLGTRAPGGAFQAGAAAAAGLVLAHLAGVGAAGRISERALRVGVAVGFALPIPLTSMMLGAGAPFLAYPGQGIVAWVLAFETAVMISVAMSLAALFVVAGSIVPPVNSRPEPPAEG
jgi:multisubunit Na+/H+ antiporter MnhB subunit